MNTIPERIFWITILLSVTGLLLAGCGEDDPEDPLTEEPIEGDAAIQVPSAYVFDSRFVEGKSSVSYSGQTVRNLLLQDLKVFIDSLGKDGARCNSSRNA